VNYKKIHYVPYPCEESLDPKWTLVNFFKDRSPSSIKPCQVFAAETDKSAPSQRAVNIHLGLQIIRDFCATHRLSFVLKTSEATYNLQGSRLFESFDNYVDKPMTIISPDNQEFTSWHHEFKTIFYHLDIHTTSFVPMWDAPGRLVIVA